MRFLLACILISAVLAVSPTQAEAAQSSEQATCAPTFTVIATAGNGAGDINLCAYYPPTVASSTSTFNVALVITAPPTTAPVFNIASSAFTLNSGCTEGTATAFPPTANGQAGTINTYLSTFTMTSEQCTIVASSNLVVGAVPTNIYFGAVAITINSENARVDNFNYLCDAPGIAPNAYSTTATTCIDPNLNATICPEATPCHHVLSGALDVNSTTIIGNQTNIMPSEIEVSFPGDVDAPGFDFWALFIFWAIVLGICLRMGWWLAAGFAIPGLLDSMFPASVPETFAVWFVFVLIGVVLEAAAAKFSWGPYRKKTGMN